MDTITGTSWDVVISGTDLRRSLVSLALSRSKKKILHIDPNFYYGGTDAAFSLDEVDDWVEKYGGSGNTSFRNASLWKVDNPEDLAKVSPSRSYTLTLSPFIIYSKSKLLSNLISSTAYRQLEFQAVGNWWIIDDVSGSHNLKKIPNGREDIFQDATIDNRSKRNLMKFLRFVIDYENQTKVWEAYAEKPLSEFLSSQFLMAFSLQKAIAGLTLTLYACNQTIVSWALPRLKRHLTSIGALGPGFGAVVSKWGSGAEILQIACRAGAVGGGIYILGTGIETCNRISENPQLSFEITLSNGSVIKTKHLVSTPDEYLNDHLQLVSRVIAISTSSFQNLIKSSIEGAPLPAVCVIVFPPGSLKDESAATHPYPVYVMVHSSETGECPEGQYVLYATTLASVRSKTILEASLSKLSSHADNGDGKILYSLYYEFSPGNKNTTQHHKLDGQPIDLAFDDQIIDEVEAEWRKITGCDETSEKFMKFDDRDNFTSDDQEGSDS